METSKEATVTPLDDIFGVAMEAGSGLENIRAKDILIPRVSILQGLSPQVTRGQPEYDESARVGMIYDVSMAKGWNSIVILPLHFLTQWLEWAPRKTGKGLIKIHEVPPHSSLYQLNDKNQMITSEGNLIQETGQLYCLNLSDGARPSFIPFSSTQLKKARKLLTMATNELVENKNGEKVTPPLFYRSYLLETIPEQNAEGNWMGWKISPDKALGDLPDWQLRLKAVKDFRGKIIAGEVKGELALDEPTAQKQIEGGAM